ncbi:MAG: hypothetical protein XD43_0886 [Thermococcales archaeon 44_46]|nr:MAG: hypothetical protein XD43_0886 [Thermococcales archaeon 44_46]HIH71812.1 hypothetical protein [Thermococcaceae archaeon]
MKKLVVVLASVLLVFSTFVLAYGNGRTPTENMVVQGIKALQRYSYVQTVEFDNYQLVPDENGEIREVFLYHGKLIETGRVDLATMSIEYTQEFYVNGTVLSRGYIKIENGNVITGYKEENGNKVVLTEENAVQLTGYGLEVLPNELLKLEPLKVVRNPQKVVPRQTTIPVMDRILMGLGVKDGRFEYEITTANGQVWLVQVDGNGLPVRLENIPKDDRHPKVVITIEA